MDDSIDAVLTVIQKFLVSFWGLIRECDMHVTVNLCNQWFHENIVILCNYRQSLTVIIYCSVLNGHRTASWCVPSIPIRGRPRPPSGSIGHPQLWCVTLYYVPVRGRARPIGADQALSLIGTIRYDNIVLYQWGTRLVEPRRSRLAMSSVLSVRVITVSLLHYEIETDPFQCHTLSVDDSKSSLV